MNNYVVNSNYKFSIPIRQKDSDPQLSDEEWINLYKKLFGNKRLSIYFGEYETNHIPTVLVNLIITDIEQLQLQYTGHSKVMKYLSFPFFKDLKKLNLSNNFITSVQFFGLIPAPNLENVCLNQNKIQNIKPFHRNRFDKLKSIDLRNNQVHELKGIQSLSVKELILQNLDYDKAMSESLLPVFKLPSRQFKILRVQGFQRISTPVIDSQMKKRWPKIWIYKKKEINY